MRAVNALNECMKYLYLQLRIPASLTCVEEVYLMKKPKWERNNAKNSVSDQRKERTSVVTGTFSHRYRSTVLEQLNFFLL